MEGKVYATGKKKFKFQKLAQQKRLEQTEQFKQTKQLVSQQFLQKPI